MKSEPTEKQKITLSMLYDKEMITKKQYYASLKDAEIAWNVINNNIWKMGRDDYMRV